MGVGISRKNNHALPFIRGRIMLRPTSFDLIILAAQLPNTNPHSMLRYIAPPFCMQDQQLTPQTRKKTTKTHLAIGHEDHLWTRLVIFLGFRTAENAQYIGRNSRRMTVRLESLFLFIPIDDIAKGKD